jgi:endonuclease/exonuclease/phosphatase (EEP) superfamily protein YafD
MFLVEIPDMHLSTHTNLSLSSQGADHHQYQNSATPLHWNLASETPHKNSEAKKDISHDCAQMHLHQAQQLNHLSPDTAQSNLTDDF